jgi:hypothetical protein
MPFARWLRATSERYLMVAAQQEMAARYRIPPPRRPGGAAGVFWLRVYVPAYRALPWAARSALMRRMPGSHRMTWTKTQRPRGPAPAAGPLP